MDAGRAPGRIAIVGPFASGKTSLLEEILARTGAIEKPGAVANGTYGRRFLARGARPCDERGAEHRRNQIHGRELYLSRLPRLGGVQLRERAARRRRRCGDRRRRARREEDSGAAGGAPPPRRAPHSALPVPEQDRQGVDGRARRAGHAAARLRDAAGAAPDSDLEGRGRDRLHRPRARPRLRLPRACDERGDRARGRRDGRAATRRASPCWSGSPITTTR